MTENNNVDAEFCSLCAAMENWICFFGRANYFRLVIFKTTDSLFKIKPESFEALELFCDSYSTLPNIENLTLISSSAGGIILLWNMDGNIRSIECLPSSYFVSNNSTGFMKTYSLNELEKALKLLHI